MNRFLRKLAWIFRRGRKEAELRDELQFHLEEDAEAAEAAGAPREDAKSLARRELGNLGLVMEDTRAAWSWSSLERLWQDVRYAARTLRRSPVFAMTTVSLLALGIGANTAIFSLLNGVVFRPLPVSAPERLVQFSNTLPLWETGSSRQKGLFSYPQFELFQAHSKTLSGIMGGTVIGRVNVAFQETAATAMADACSGNFFSVLRIAPAYGRFFLAGEDRAGAAVAVIGDRYWRARFGADPSIVGSAVSIDRMPFTVIGIAPPEFTGIAVGYSPDLWLPLHALDRLRQANSRWTDPVSTWMWVAGRLHPGIAREQAQAELDAIQRSFLAERLSASEAGSLANVRRFARDTRLVLRPAATGMASWLRDAYALPLKLVMCVSGIVLLVVCANIANLMLARASGRRREIAARLALGASRARLVRQLLTESTALALAGGLAAAPVSVWATSALLRMISTGDARVPVNVDPDWRVFAFIAAVTLLTGILFGLAPALRCTRAGALSPIEKGGRLAGRSSLTLDRTLVVVQVAFSVILIAAAGLLLRTLQKLSMVNVGYDRENVLMVSVDAKLAGYSGERAGPVYQEILRRLQAIPTVNSAGASIVRPVDDQFHLLDRVDEIDGRRLSEDAVIRVAWNAISPGYFATMATPLVSGRDFDLRDGEDAPEVAIVSESLAALAFPNRNPIGRRLGGATIVGVVGNSLYSGARDVPRPVLYRPLFQHGPGKEYNWGFVSFELRYSSLAGLLDAARREVAAVDPHLPVFRAKTLLAQSEESLLKERLLAALSTYFGALALLVACVGLYGLTAYTVAGRTAELGIRLALGAPRAGIAWLVVRETLWLAAAGIAAGVPLAVGAARYAKSVLFGIGAADPPAIAATVAVLLGVAALAAYLPARRALRLDPMAALRCE